MFRIEVNVQTGEITQIELTAEEIAALQAQAAEAALNNQGVAPEATQGV